MDSDGNLAPIYTLIHSFLTKHSHTKAAQAVKKAAKEVIILKDDIDIEGPQLDEIIAQWKLLKASTRKDSSSSESDSESSSGSSSSSSGSSSSESDSDSDLKKPIKAVASIPLAQTRSSSSSSLSSSGSSSSESDSDSDLKKTIKAVASVPLAQTKSSSSSSSSSSGSSSSESDSDSDLKKPIKAVVSKSSVPLAQTKSSSGSSSSSSGSSSSESDSVSDIIKKPIKAVVSKSVSKSSVPLAKTNSSDKKLKVERDSSRTLSSENTSCSNSGSNGGNDKESPISSKRESSTSADPSSEADTPEAQVEQVQVTKKRRMDRDGTAVITATASTVRKEASGPMSTGRIKGKAKPGRQVNERFRRVDPSKMEPIADNRYVAKVAPTNDYGQRAHEDLIVTRGQGFRKEKNKKKKGSYRGGEITMESHSFKFA